MRLLVSPDGDGYKVLPSRDGETVFSGRLEVRETPKGPRPAKLRVRRDGDDETRQPDEFVDLARMADEVVYTASADGFGEMAALLDAYGVGLRREEVCRLCLVNNRFTSLHKNDAVLYDGERICVDCARDELRREASFRGVSSTTRDRLNDLLRRVGEVDKVVALLEGSLDPELTKFDEMDENVAEPVPLDETPLSDEVRELLEFNSLLPVQSASVDAGLLDGDDLLVASATATGKTLVGEIAGLHNLIEGRGKTLFLVPLVALANQKYDRFDDMYGDRFEVTQRVGSNRISARENRFDPDAEMVVGTYEGVDHALRTGRDLGEVGTVVIDEVHNLQDEDRGHRLDGLIARLHEAHDAQYVYLSATVGNPEALANALGARPVEYEERPVPIERHLTFADETEKKDIVERLVKREYNRKSSKGYRGQTIVFTNSRRRCHELAGALPSAAAYHAGLSGGERKSVERAFGDQEMAAVVTTAALGAGVDFPASQVIFERLAMGIEWLSVGEFEQMLGRAGRPDYHDRGVVYVLAEPDAVYHNSMERTEDEVALDLLKGETEDVIVDYTQEAADEQTLANIAFAGEDHRRVSEALLGEFDIDRALGRLRDAGLVRGDEITRLGHVTASRFLTLEQATTVIESVERGDDPLDTVAELELLDANE
ncbi:MAG: DEAD/DEAH box helicase [Halobacteriales archaeon]